MSQTIAKQVYPEVLQPVSCHVGSDNKLGDTSARAIGSHWDTKDSGQPSPTPSNGLPRGIKRGASACDQCHRFKVKCIREQDQCRRCIANGSRCTYSFSAPAASHVRNETAESHRLTKQHRDSHSGQQLSPMEGTRLFR